MVAHIGELAAFGTAVSWTIASLIMEEAVRRSGVMAVNTLKVAFGTVYLALLAFFLNGSFFPANVPLSAWLFLVASGLIGFVLGDYFLFHAYALIGSRLSMLLMAISVPLTTLSASIIWGEKPGRWALAGIALCVAGIAVTVTSGGKKDASAASVSGDASRSFRYRKGVIYGVLSAVFNTVAMLLTKAGASGVDSVSATQIRIFSAFAGFLCFAIVTRKTAEIAGAIKIRRNLALIALGGIFGPFVGVSCLLFALQHAGAGVVSTLSSLTPVLIIPPAVLIFRRKVQFAEIVGACLAMCGLALLFV